MDPVLPRPRADRDGAAGSLGAAPTGQRQADARAGIDLTASGGRYRALNLGCKANAADLEALAAELRADGWREAASDESAELVVVNSCTVTDEADRQSRATARRAARRDPRARVVYTGCAAEVDPATAARIPGVTDVVGNQDKARLPRLLAAAAAPAPGESARILGGVAPYAELRSRHPHEREWPSEEAAFHPAPAFDGERARTRGFLKVQEGCDAFCTYCVIPYGRGPSRSLAPARAVDAARGWSGAGAREIVLTGTNLGEYGGGTGALVALLGDLLAATPETTRYRLGSLDPVQITPELIELVGDEPRICPHFHVSLQSAHERTLRAMKRGYGAREIEACLAAIARLPVARTGPGGAMIGMDVIAGFPGESDAEFAEGLARLRAWPWTRLHVFPYSERRGTPATRLGGRVDPAVRRARARTLLDLSLERARERAEAVLSGGETLSGVLLEKPGGRTSGPLRQGGYTANYVRVLVEVTATSARNRWGVVRPRRIWVDAAAGEIALESDLIELTKESDLPAG